MACLKKRGDSFQIQYYAHGRQRRVSIGTVPLQLAKEKLRQFESAQLRGVDNPLPTRTPLPEILSAYVQHIRTAKKPKSAQTDVYYLREMFGPICRELEITSRKVSEANKKRPRKPGRDGRCRMPVIEAAYLETISTTDASTFITAHTRSRGLAPKTANRYREILVRLFNWAMQQRDVRMPGDRNPAAKVERYRESAPEIRYLSLAQIDEQLAALADQPQLQAMVAVLIYAGLRREELLWLTLADVEIPNERPRVIHVRAKTVNGESWEAKTKQNRSVPISSTLYKYLKDYTPRPSIGGWYFPSPEGCRWDPDNFSNHLRRTSKITGQSWTCLDYRHSFGSHLAQSGISLYQIATLMGNSPEICRRHYASLSPQCLSLAVEFGVRRRAAESTGPYGSINIG